MDVRLLLNETECFGVAKVEVIHSWQEAERGWLFHKFPGGLSHYRAQLPESAAPPIMALNNITLSSQHRGLKLGYAGTAATMRHFQETGVRAAFLRIGTPPEEDWYTGKVWRQKMYENLGWRVLENHPEYKGDVPVMWHDMTGKLLCPRIDEVTLDVSKDKRLSPIWSTTVP